MFGTNNTRKGKGHWTCILVDELSRSMLGCTVRGRARQGLDADVQAMDFSRMARVAARDELAIENGNGQRVVVGVKARSLRALP